MSANAPRNTGWEFPDYSAANLFEDKPVPFEDDDRPLSLAELRAERNKTAKLLTALKPGIERTLLEFLIDELDARIGMYPGHGQESEESHRKID